MRSALIDASEIIPVEPPHKPESVNYLLQDYIPPAFWCRSITDWDYHQNLDNKIPWCFVHYVKGSGLYMVDGHHRAGLDHMVGRHVRAIFLDTLDDLNDAYTLVDMGMIPKFELGISPSQIPNLDSELPEARSTYAMKIGVKTFDDFCEMLSRGEYVEFVYGIGPMYASSSNSDILGKMWERREPILEWSEDLEAA